jgi:hypothetical protein
VSRPLGGYATIDRAAPDVVAAANSAVSAQSSLTRWTSPGCEEDR